MLDHLLTYSLEDFMPMGADVYLRLFERVNASFWPWHLLTLGICVLLIYLLVHKHEKFVWPLLGAMWIVTGLQFHWRFFSELNWAAIYFTWGFIIQGVILSLMFFSAESKYALNRRNYTLWFGSLLIVFGVLIFPLLSLVLDHNWRAAEVFGVSPNPTCLVTLGVLLQGRRQQWWVILIPLLWCLISGAIGYALSLVSGLFMLFFGILFVFVKVLNRPKRYVI